MRTNDEARREAERRYWNDPEFHARAHLAVNAVEATLPDGGRLDRDDWDLATLAACLALVAAELPIVNDLAWQGARRG